MPPAQGSRHLVEAELLRKPAGGESQQTDRGCQGFQTNRTAERDASVVLLEKLPGRRPATVGRDKGFDTRDLVKECRNLQVTSHPLAETSVGMHWPRGVPSRRFR